MCTTTIVGKDASADGSVMISHSDDGHIENDSSIVYVPRVPINADGDRAVYPTADALGEMPEYNTWLRPRIQKDDGPKAYRHEDFPRTIPIGSVPYKKIFEVLGETGRDTTYAYLDGSYGISNEWGLMFGECTNGAKASFKPVLDTRIFYASELSRVALENCKTARDAVKLIGFLIDEYGYWGTGETLPVGDPKEAWVIEMAPVKMDYRGPVGGLWVAQRVPDDEFFIGANEFRIRDIDPGERNKTLMYSDHLFDVAKEWGWFTPSSHNPDFMDWLPTVSKGEYSHPYYSLRRVWRGLSLMAPSRKLDPWAPAVDKDKEGLTRAYPFSVKPDKKITLSDVIALHRDHYADTEFDLTKGMAAGPWGNPNRYLGPRDPSGDVGDPDVKLAGAWERPIGMYYTNVTFVNQARSDLPYPINTVSWIALDAPAESVFVPLAVGPIPSMYESYNAAAFNMDGNAWQIYNLVAEYANIKYCYMIKDINRAQRENERSGFDLVAKLRVGLAEIALRDPEEALKKFSEALNRHALTVHANWKRLFEQLVVHYNQGEVLDTSDPSKPVMTKVDYPESWLKETNYFTGPTKYEKNIFPGPTKHKKNN
ncbi:MAG: C69 family dipeptidase [Spirochaetaceae bacterium]|jgi:dipeptidase|nr:C69 family dipeptidase [Spirochaetaceae bacterium]